MPFSEEFARRILSNEDPISLAAAFIEWWYEPFPLLPEHGSTESEISATEDDLGFRLPEILRCWYALCGRRLESLTHQDVFLTLSELNPPSPSSTLFLFHAENQGVVCWGIQACHLALADPPVYIYERTRPIERDNDSLAKFLLITLIYEASFQAESTEDTQQLGVIMSALCADATPQSSIWPRRVIGLESPAEEDVF